VLSRIYMAGVSVAINNAKNKCGKKWRKGRK